MVKHPVTINRPTQHGWKRKREKSTKYTANSHNVLGLIRFMHRVRIINYNQELLYSSTHFTCLSVKLPVMKGIERSYAIGALAVTWYMQPIAVAVSDYPDSVLFNEVIIVEDRRRCW